MEHMKNAIMNKTASFHTALFLSILSKTPPCTLIQYCTLIYVCQNSTMHAYLGLHAYSDH